MFDRSWEPVPRVNRMGWDVVSAAKAYSLVLTLELTDSILSIWL